MKTKILTIISLLLIFAACQKEKSTVTSGLSLAAVKAAYHDTLTVDWSKATLVHYQGKDGWIIALNGQPTYRGAKQGYRKIVFLDSAEKIQEHILEIIPDLAYLYTHHGADTRTFTGQVFVYSSSYHLEKGMIYNNGKQAGKIKPQTTPAAGGSFQRTDALEISQTCTWIDDNYVDADDVATIYSYQVCTTDIYDDGDSGGGAGSGGGGDALGSGGGGGGSTASAPANAPVLPGQTKNAINPKDFMKCFGNLPDIGSKETITVYVQEPQPGLPFNYGGNSVGHTTISLSKSYGGQTITQTVGFYPTNSKLAATGTTGKLVDNGGLDYTVSITYQVEPFEFNAIANYVAGYNADYNLYTNNCTNFVYNACLQGNITLPDPTGNTGMFQTGMTPAALGSSISDLQGNEDVNTNGGTVGESHGPCN